MNQPVVSPLDDGELWRVMEDYLYYLDDGRLVYIPRSFVSDFATTPRILWWLYPPATNKHRTGALVHDWLVATGHPWVDSARIFRTIMTASGVSYWTRNIMYYAVLSFGIFHKKDPRENELKTLQRIAIKWSNVKDKEIL